MSTRVLNARPRANADLLPVRMCNEFVYCPRLFFLEHVQGIFVASADTVEGSAQHDRAERRGQIRQVKRRSPLNVEPIAITTRTLTITSENWGTTGKIDILEVQDASVVVIESKKGRAPKRDDHTWREHALPYRAWPADVIQVGLYMAMLRDNGVACEEARIQYRASRDTTPIPWSSALELFLHEVVRAAQQTAELTIPPAPLLDSPKCPGCSLHSVCLPDEHHAQSHEKLIQLAPPIRQIVPGRDDRSVIYALSPGTVIRKSGDSLLMCLRDKPPERFLLKDVAHIALFGPCSLTQPCQTHLLRHGIAVSHHTSAGQLLGTTAPLSTVNIAMRQAQFRGADDPERRLAATRAIVRAKIHNQRTLLRRYKHGLPTEIEQETGGALPEWATPVLVPQPTKTVAQSLTRMQVSASAAKKAPNVDVLRGHEGEAAAAYFSAFASILPSPWSTDFTHRNRRPPKDPINALLSFGYALLVRETTAALARVGLDPMLGLFHTVRAGRPSLSLDIMEPFRPAWVDTSIMRLLATRGITPDDFSNDLAGVQLSDYGRRKFIAAFERRGAELTTHPTFGYRLSYRRLVELEARMLAKWLLREVATFQPFRSR